MTTTKTIRVKKPADPMQPAINKMRAEREQRIDAGKVNKFRDDIGYLSWGAKFFRKYLK